MADRVMKRGNVKKKRRLELLASWVRDAIGSKGERTGRKGSRPKHDRRAAHRGHRSKAATGNRARRIMTKQLQARRLAKGRNQRTGR